MLQLIGIYFFRLGDNFSSLKSGVNPRFLYYQVMATFRVETVEDWVHDKRCKGNWT